MNPLASSDVHPFCISPYSPSLVLTRSLVESTPTVSYMYGRRCMVTLPLTLRWLDSSMASISRITGSMYWLSCRNMPYQLATWSFQYCCHLESVNFSRNLCAEMMSIGAAASNPTRPLMPMMVSPTCMSRPIPYGAAIVSTAWMAFTPFS